MTRRPHVVLLVDSMTEAVAGAERTVLWLGMALPAHGFDVTVVTTRVGRGWPLQRLEEAGAEHLDLARRARVDVLPFLQLARWILRHRVDVVHSHMFGSNVWGTLIGRALRVPVVIAHEHSWPFEGEPVRRALDFLIGRLADAFVAVSSADAALMRSYEHVPARRIRTIPSGWSPVEAGSGDVDLRAELGIPADAPVIGTVAHLRQVKRLELLVQAFARVRESVPDAWLLIGGDGPERGTIEAEAQRLGVDERLRITGTLADPMPAWRAIDVAAMTSDREGTPIAALEAMAAGVPMVAPAVGGIPELFETGGGLLFAPHDVAALADELVALLGDPERREVIGAAGRARSADFTVARQVERCVALYRELLAGDRRSQRRRRRSAGAGA